MTPKTFHHTSVVHFLPLLPPQHPWKSPLMKCIAHLKKKKKGNDMAEKEAGSEKKN